MRSVKQSRAGWRIFSGCISITIFIGGLFASSAVLAQNDVYLGGCVQDQDFYNAGLNCTANDTTLSSPTIAIIKECNFPGDFATLNVTVDITVGAQTRYDLGVWIATDGDPNGDGAATGQCAALSVPNNLIHVDQTTSTFGDGDYCGDVFNVDPDGVVVPPTEDAHLLGADLGTFNVPCNDTDGDGKIDVPIIVAWKQQANNDCPASNYVVPGTASKCVEDLTFALDVPIPGQIIVDKVTVPADDTVFNFLLEGPPSGIEGGFDGSEGFSLSDASAPFDTAVFTGGLMAGVYSVSEEPAPGYVLTASCTGSEGAEDPAAIDVAPGETVNCTFTNTLDSATINVVKSTVGGNGEFAINWSGPSTSGGVVLNTGESNTDSDTIVTTETGTFELTELIPPGWELIQAGCVDDDGGAIVGVWDGVDTIPDINLTPGDSFTCTFTNAALGSVTLIKSSIGGIGSFDFVTDVPGLGTNIQTAGGTGQTSASNVPAGIYSIVETVPPGWILDSATCSDDSPPDALDISDGETVTCTFTNIKLGSLILEKQTLPDGDPASFDFTGDVVATLSDGQNTTLQNLVPGSYTTTETPLGGWVLTDITCDDENSSGDTVSGETTFNVEAGETVKCIYTNTKDGSIEVVKSLAATGPVSELFSFTSSFNGDFDLEGDAATTGPIPVTPGSGYTVSENDPTASGWAVIGAICTGGDVPSTNITVSPGEAVVCTFTNTPLGSATIIKNTIGGDGIFDFTGDAPFNGLQLSTQEGTASQDFTYVLDEGFYEVTEEPVPEGWALTGLNCEETGIQDTTFVIPTATMGVQFAETVTCTFTNTADGTLIIRKETIPDASAQGFDFTGSASGTLHDYSDTGEELTVSGQPGTYTSAETVPDGWALTDISCTGQEQGITIGENDVSVDLEAGATVICTFENTALGSVTIEKLSQGDVGAFNFNGDFGAFPLDTTGANPDSITFGDLLPDTYMVSEIIPTNWTLSNISCSPGTNSTITIGGAGGFDPGDQGVTINLLDGEDITCTFVNDAHGSITVAKGTEPTGSSQAFDFTGAITATLTDGQSSDTIMVPAGNYDVTESAVTGWDVTDISCSNDGSSGAGSTASFVVASGEDVVCVFTNTIQPGQIIVDKVTDPSGSTQSFDFTLTGTGVNQGFALTDAAAPYNSGDLLPTSENGSYNVSESLPAGWVLTSATCSDGSAASAVDLAPGEVVTCTFTNTIIPGQIIVDKVTDPSGSTQSFDFTLTGTGVNQGFALTDAAAPYNSGDLLPTSENGAYNVSESLPAGWVLTSAICSDGSLASAVDLSPGEVVTCTFTNTIQNGGIIVDKVTDPSGSTQSFGFTLTGNGVDQGFALTDGATPYNSGELLPTSENGTYNVSESLPAGWTATSAICSDGSLASAVDLSPGEVVTCTFTNTIQRGNIVVVKQTDPDGSIEAFGFTSNYGDAFSLTDGQQNDSGPLLPTSEASTYSVAEDAKDGWDLSSAVCSGEGNTPASITLLPGETVTCTFTNTIQRGNIVVVKQTDPDGSTEAFGFTSNYGDAFSLTDDQQNDSGPLLPTSEASTYSVAEDAKDGWDLSSAVCSGEGNTPASITLLPGDTVTCTFTNTIQRGNIVVVKQTDPTGSLEDFGFTSNYGDAFSLTDGQQNDSGPLLPTSEASTYSVAEDVEPGWELTSAVCSGEGNTPESITLLPGETVTCTFTNIGSGSLTIVKRTDTDGTFLFDFNGPDYGAYLVEITTSGGIGQEVFLDLPTGSYSLTELDPAPFILLSATCDNGDEPANLTVDPGEDVTCTFVNGQPVPVPVNNPWALLLLTLMMLAAGLYFRPAAMRRF